MCESHHYLRPDPKKDAIDVGARLLRLARERPGIITVKRDGRVTRHAPLPVDSARAVREPIVRKKEATKPSVATANDVAVIETMVHAICVDVSRRARGIKRTDSRSRDRLTADALGRFANALVITNIPTDQRELVQRRDEIVSRIEVVLGTKLSGRVQIPPFLKKRF